MAPRRHRRRRAAAAAVGMAGPPPPGVDLLLPAGRPGAAGARRRAAPRSRSTVMSALAPTMQAFFTERLQRQRQASPNTIAAYRDTFRLLLTFAEQQTGKTPSQLQVDDLDARADHRVPGLPRARARQQHLDPQRAAGGDPLAVSLRRAQAPRARRHDRPRAGDPAQTRPADHRDVPARRGDRRAAGRARPRALDRPSRPRAAADHDPDRTARLRADRPALRRHHAEHRSAPALPRQGPQSNASPR